MTQKSRVFAVATLLFILSAVGSFFLVVDEVNPETGKRFIPRIVKVVPTSIPTPTPIPTPDSHIIPEQLHVFQSYNNCGPATLSMAMSYMGVQKDQKELGEILRPYQISGGDNDDKSVTLEEVADQAEVYGLHSYLRANGTIEKLQKFIANDISVVARTWTKTDEDIGHFRIVRGYDRDLHTILQDDSLQNDNLTYSESEFLTLWQPFNYEYLVIVNDEKKDIAEQILGDELDPKIAWQDALRRLEFEMEQDPSNWHLTFALSRVYFHLGEYKRSVEAFEKVENTISNRTLWYQIEPIMAYYELGNYDRVFEITDDILSNHNAAFSELYIIRGKIYQKQDQDTLAREQFEKAVFYNKNLKEAHDALNSL